MARTISIEVDDDIYAMLSMYNNFVQSSGGVKRTVEDFAYILIGVGMVQVGKALAPASDAEMRALTLNILIGTPERADLLAMYRQSVDEGRKTMGFITDTTKK